MRGSYWPSLLHVALYGCASCALLRFSCSTLRLGKRRVVPGLVRHLHVTTSQHVRCGSVLSLLPFSSDAPRQTIYSSSGERTLLNSRIRETEQEYPRVLAWPLRLLKSERAFSLALCTRRTTHTFFLIVERYVNLTNSLNNGRGFKVFSELTNQTSYYKLDYSYATYNRSTVRYMTSNRSPRHLYFQ